MFAFMAAEAIWIGGGFAAYLAGKSARWATLLGVGSALSGCALAFIPTMATLAGGQGEKLVLPLSFPGASLSLGIDPISAFFLLPILILAATTAIYGGEYMLSFRGERRIGYSWFLFNLVVAGMSLVVTARNAILFLVAWEVMTLASAFLVMFEDRKKAARDAGWLYLVATHLGTAFLLPFFALLAVNAGSFEFDEFESNRAIPAMGFLFFLSLVGFGTKAGLMPFHVWLPEAHPAAPSHVSALMSGVIIKTGIYGIVRSLTFFGSPPAWWGWALIWMGAISGVMGVLLALAQHDLKRLLAYHSVENIGIIAMGLGIGILGVSHGSAALAVLGFGGGLLHVLNHALFKGLLFLGAGTVAHATGTRDMDRLGGLLRRMPWTGGFFLLASVAISGLPPLNGFVSEFLIYGASFGAVSQGNPSLSIAGVLVLVSLSLIGGLAAACFAKAFGTVFLGSSRQVRDEPVHKESPAMVLPMAALALGCVVIGFCGPYLATFLGPVISQIVAVPLAQAGAWPAPANALLKPLLMVSWVGVALVGIAAWARAAILRRRIVAAGPTWDCGYAQPSNHMQYSASSFAQPLTAYFQPVLGTRKKMDPMDGLLPAPARFHTETPDSALEWLYRPLAIGIIWTLGRLRWLQHGKVQFYVLYVTLALLALLVWKLGKS